MQKVTILCVGKLKEKFYMDAAAEYVKRLSRFCKLELVELPEERLPEDPSPAQIEAALLKEAAAIRAKLPSGAALIALCVEGEPRSSEALARQIEEQHRERVSPFAFSKCGISEGAELEFCCRGNEQPASAAPSPTTSMCAFRTKYGPWPHWRSICWGPGIRSPGLSISNTTARG